MNQPVATPLHIARVAFYLHALDEGGAQRRTVTLARLLAQRGIAVDLLVVDDRGPLRKLVPDDVRVLLVGHALSKLPWVRARRVRQVQAAIPSVALYVRCVRPDVLVSAANHTAIATVRAHRLAACCEVALVLRVSNALTSRERAGGNKRSRAMRAALRYVDAVAAVSRSLGVEVDALCGTPRPEVRTVANPVIDLSAVSTAINRPDVETSRPAPMVVGLGRVVPQKDFETLLRAFARVPSHLNARLLILGEGPDRVRLQALARSLGVAERVELPGHVVDPLPELQRADLFVLSSRWEGMPASLIEAMACGCAVISTDIPGAREVLRDGALGPLVPPGDVEAMAAAITTALERMPDTTALARRAQDFSFEAAAQQFIEVLELARQRRLQRV